MSRRPLVAAGSLLALALVSTPAVAQSKFEFTPYVGAYFPTKPLVADTSGGATIFETNSGPAVGGRLTYWVSPRVGLEGSFGVASSKTHLFAGTTELEFRSSTYMADARVLFQVNNPSSPTGLHLSGGVALTKASNAFFSLADEVDQLTYDPSIGFVVGAGVSRRIASGLRLRIDLEDRIYTAKFDVPSGGTDIDDETQHDIVFSTGLAFSF
jgi:hypothetical protein